MPRSRRSGSRISVASAARMPGASAAPWSPCAAIAATMTCAQSRTAELELMVSGAHRRSLARQMVLEAERYAAVHHELVTRGVARLVGRQKCDRFGNVLRRAERADRDAAAAQRAHLGVLVDRRAHSGVDEAGCDGIDANAVRPERQREVLRQQRDAGL